MKFSDVKENTWIRYKGNVYYVSQVHHDYIEVSSLDYDIIEIPDIAFLKNPIELIETNFNVGDVVLYIGSSTYQPQTMVEIIEYSASFLSQYYVKTLDDDMSLWVTAFDIMKINY